MKYYLIRYRFSSSGEEINYSSRGSGVSESSLGGRHNVPKTCLYTRCTGSRCRRNILIKKYHSSFPRTKKPPEVSPDWQRTASSSSGGCFCNFGARFKNPPRAPAGPPDGYPLLLFLARKTRPLNPSLNGTYHTVDFQSNSYHLDSQFLLSYRPSFEVSKLSSERDKIDIFIQEKRL